MRMMRGKAYWTVAGEERGVVIAPKDEVEDDEGRHAIQGPREKTPASLSYQDLRPTHTRS